MPQHCLDDLRNPDKNWSIFSKNRDENVKFAIFFHKYVQIYDDNLLSF